MWKQKIPTKRPLAINRLGLAWFGGLILLMAAPSAIAAPELGVVMDTAAATRFPFPYGYGIRATYHPEPFYPSSFAIDAYEVQADRGDGVWRTTHSMRDPDYEWANIHGSTHCNADLRNLPSRATIKVRVRALYHRRPDEPDDELPIKSGAMPKQIDGALAVAVAAAKAPVSRWSDWSRPVAGTVSSWTCPCGNKVCEAGEAETHSVCPVDCSNRGGFAENPTVPWVETKFNTIDKDGTKLGMWFTISNMAMMIDIYGNPYGLLPYPVWNPVNGFNNWYDKDFRYNYFPGVNDLATTRIPPQIHELRACHIQGVQRLRKSPYLAFSFNSKAGGKPSDINWCEPYEGGGAHLMIVKMNSKTSAGTGQWDTNRGGGSRWNTPREDHIVTNVLMDGENYHPGGLQVIGDYLVVGMDHGHNQGSEIKFFDVSAPSNPVHRNTFSIPDGGHRAESLGIVRLADRRYLMAISSENARQLDFYLSDGTVLQSTGFTHVGTWQHKVEGVTDDSVPLDKANDSDWINYSSYNLVRESGTNKVYLIGLGRNRAKYCGTPLDGSDYIHLFELTDWDERGLVEPNACDDMFDPACCTSSRCYFETNDEYECICPTSPMAATNMKALAEKHMKAPDANFCAGAGLYVRPDTQGTLAVYSTEHQGDFEDGELESFRWAYELNGLQPLNLPPQSGVIRFNEFWSADDD